MKNSKKLFKLVALAVLLGGVTCSSNVWAESVTITIDGTTMSAYSTDAHYGIYNSSVTGGTTVAKVETKSGGIAFDANVAGILIDQGTKTVDFAGTGSSISIHDTVDSNTPADGIVLAGSSGAGLTVNNLEAIDVISVQRAGGITCGILWQTDTALQDSVINFTGDGSIKVKSTGGDGDGDYACGIELYNISNSPKIQFNNVGNIETAAGFGAYGYCAESWTTGIPIGEVNFKPGSVITAKGEYVSMGAYLCSGINYIGTKNNELTGIKAGFNDDGISSGVSFGIGVSAGDNIVAFSGADSFIESKSSETLAYGIAFGSVYYDEYYVGTGKTTITGLGSITAESTSQYDSILACGIYVTNGNDETDGTTFTVFFDSTNGGTINVYSVAGRNYGIYFPSQNEEGIEYATGVSEIKNVKAIVAGVDPDDSSKISTGSAYGIYAMAGVNRVDFADGGTISVTGGADKVVSGISVGGGTTIVSNLSDITVSGGTVAKIAFTDGDSGVLILKNSNIAATDGVDTVSVTSNGTLNLQDGTKVYGKVNVADGKTLAVTIDGTSELHFIGTSGTGTFNIKQEEGAILAVAAASLPKGTTLITGVNDASQLDVEKGTLIIEGTEAWGYYSLVSGKAVIDGSLNPAKLWLVRENLDEFKPEYDIKDGVVTLEFRNIPLAVEANTSALAGVQQGAITMVNQIADAIGENVGIIARPAQEGVYDKTIWANYINSKETVNGMSMWRGTGDNTAKYHGVTVGADFYTTKKAIAGVALTYVTGDITSNPSDTHINNKTKYYGISFYDRVTNGKGAWTYDLGYSQGKNEISQNSYQTVTADAKTNTYTLGAKYEYAYNFKHSSLVPFASLRYLRLNSKDYSNSNGHNMSINNQNLIVPKLGLAWTGNFEMPKSGWNFKPVAEVGYIWNLKGREADGTFTTRNSAYSLQYDTVDKSSYYTKLGMNFNKKNFTGGVSYRYAKGDAARQNSWNVNLSWSF